MQIPIQALELARFADLTKKDSQSVLQWLQIRPLGEHILQASATNGAMLGQFAWLTSSFDRKEVYLDAKELTNLLGASGKRNRKLGGALDIYASTLQIGNDAPKPLTTAPPEDVTYPNVEAVLPEEELDEEVQGTMGTVLGVNLKLMSHVYQWLHAVDGKSEVRMVVRGPYDPIRIDVPVFDTGGRALFVVMPCRL